MSFGLTVSNDNSFIQIDSQTPRLCSVYNGTYAATGDRVARVTFPAPIATEEPPCIFIRNSPDRANELYDGMTISGSAGNWTGFSISANNINWRPAGKWFAAVFASRAAAQYGLRMWSEKGSLVYDSGAAPVIMTRASHSWAYAGSTQHPPLGNAYYWVNGAVGPLKEDEYFMINPFSRGQLSPSLAVWNVAGVRFDYGANRMQLFIITNRPGGVWIDIGQPSAVFARLPGT